MLKFEILANDQRADPVLPQRSRCRQVVVRSVWHAHRRSLHRFVHDPHWPLPGRSQAAGQQPGLWVAPATKMDESELIKEGHYANFGAAGARTEMPGCSLCMGNQAQVREGATVVSTSTRNFPNRLGKNATVFLASAELAAIASKLGHIPTVAWDHEAMGVVNKDGAAIYKTLNFNQIEEYVENAKGVTA